MADNIESIMAENVVLHLTNEGLRAALQKLDADNVALRVACMAMILAGGGKISIPSRVMEELAAQIGALTIGVEQEKKDLPYGITYQLVRHGLDEQIQM